MNTNSKQTLIEWRDKVDSCTDFRPEENVYRVARKMFTDHDLFDTEMDFIFENTWIYACHESQVANPHDFFTMQAGRQGMIITRDGTVS